MGNCIPRLISFILPLAFLMQGCGTTSEKLDDLAEDHQVEEEISNRAPASFGHLPTKLLWPVESKKISRHFNPSVSNYHDGIDIPARTGTKILSVADGKVIYAGRKFRGYGKMVLIGHPGGLATLYAHCHQIFVKSGQEVERGQKIALVGRTGRASAPHLHFEVRKDKKPVDPLDFFP